MMMKVAMLWIFTAILAWPESISQGDRDRAMSHLHATRKMFLDSLVNVSEAQWNFKPAPEVWSIAECAEHITLSEDLLYQLVTEKIMKSPAAPEKKELTKGRDEFILKAIADRSAKFKAPEMLQPKRRWTTQREVTDHFRQSRDRMIEYVEKTQDDLRSHFADHPVAKTLDAYQWILLVAAHTDRHTQQINEVKAHPNFPK
jgi:hypothetical protein